MNRLRIENEALLVNDIPLIKRAKEEESRHRYALEVALRSLDAETTTMTVRLRTENDDLRRELDAVHDEMAALQKRRIEDAKIQTAIANSNRASAEGMRHVIRILTETIQDLKQKVRLPSSLIGHNTHVIDSLLPQRRVVVMSANCSSRSRT